MEAFDRNINLLIKAIIASSTFLFMSFFIVTTIELYGKGINFCFSDNCLGNFLEYYKNTLKILPSAIALLTVVFLWHASRIYIHTYNTTHNNNLNTQMVNKQTTYLNHYNNFSEILSHYLSKVDLISIHSIDKFEFYHFIYNDSLNGDFSISVKYKEFICEINNTIDNLEINAIRDKEYILHINEIVDKFSVVGFVLPNCQRKEFMKIEANCYKLLNLINKSIKADQIKEPTHCF